MYDHWISSNFTPPRGRRVHVLSRAAMVCLCAVLGSGAAMASSLGMVTDNATDELHLFDAETGATLASLKGSTSRISADCALSNDQVTGYTSHADKRIAVYRLPAQPGPASIEISSIEISNAGADISLSPDGDLLVSVGAGNPDQPLSIVDTHDRQEITAISLFLDHTSAEFCDDGTLLVTTTHGHSWAMPHDNAVYDARVSPAGMLQLGGNRLSSGAQPNNASCAPGSRAGVLLDREHGLTSFTLPGLTKVGFEKLQGRTANAAVFSREGDRLYVRTSETVEAFDFNPLTGALVRDWVQQMEFSSEFFGIDQIAIDPVTERLYVDGGQSLLILDPADGSQSGAIATGDATGVCFAQRTRQTPIVDVAAITIGRSMKGSDSIIHP